MHHGRLLWIHRAISAQALWQSKSKCVVEGFQTIAEVLIFNGDDAKPGMYELDNWWVTMLLAIPLKKLRPRLRTSTEIHSVVRKNLFPKKKGLHQEALLILRDEYLRRSASAWRAGLLLYCHPVQRRRRPGPTWHRSAWQMRCLPA